ncbi:MAG TPA: ABC transporter permease [Gemmatimonadaceae bacterium]|nr:ABC transporter permease [Gemmatimonadaceae bacterium]
MTAFLLRRAAHALTVVFVVCTVTFLLVHLAPGGPAVLADPKLTQEEQAAIEERLGLDQPIPVQYGIWISRVARGELGESFLYQVPNRRAIAERLPNTVLLAGSALLLSVLLAVPLGLVSAIHRGGVVDRVVSGVVFLAMAVPTFWLAILAIFTFAVAFPVFPAGGATTAGASGSLVDRLSHLVMPAVVLAAVTTAELLRYMRSSAQTALAQPFIRVARAKGLRERTVAWRHVLRNALVPVVTALGIQLPRLVGGAAITETVFAWPGLGRLGIQAALGRDYPLVMAITLFVSAAVVVVNLLIDVLYLWIDPRIRLEA